MMAIKIFIVAMFLMLAVGYIGMYQFYEKYYRFTESEAAPSDSEFKDLSVLEFTSEDGHGVEAWFVPPTPNNPIVLFFPGNHSSAIASLRRVKRYQDAGFGVAMLLYRGMPEVGGMPSQATLTMDARALYDQLDDLVGETVSPSRRVVHGFSLGSAVGSHLASERPVGFVILEATFSKVCKYYSHIYYGLPFCWFMWKDRYPIIDWIEDIEAPLLIVHGDEDKALPVALARELFDAAVAPKRFKIYPGAGHADLPKFGMLDDAVAFIREARRPDVTSRSESHSG